MKKILKKLWISWMFIIIISFFAMNGAKASHEHDPVKPPIYDTPGMVKKPVAVYCGPTEFMLDTAVRKFSQEPLVVGKVIISQTGETVGLLTVLVNKDQESDMSVLMTILDKNETCLLGYGVQLNFYKGEPT